MNLLEEKTFTVDDIAVRYGMHPENNKMLQFEFSSPVGGADARLPQLTSLLQDAIESTATRIKETIVSATRPSFLIQPGPGVRYETIVNRIGEVVTALTEQIKNGQDFITAAGTAVENAVAAARKASEKAGSQQSSRG